MYGSTHLVSKWSIVPAMFHTFQQIENYLFQVNNTTGSPANTLS